MLITEEWSLMQWNNQRNLLQIFFFHQEQQVNSVFEVLVFSPLYHDVFVCTASAGIKF